jgi:hypothetical protein
MVLDVPGCVAVKDMLGIMLVNDAKSEVGQLL